MLSEQFNEIKFIIEKARTSTSIPKGTSLVRKDIGESVPKGTSPKKMKGGAEYVPKASSSKKTAGKIPVYWQGEGKGFPVRYINPGTPMPEGYGPSPKIKQEETKSSKGIQDKVKKIKEIKEEIKPPISTKSLENAKAENYENMISYIKDAYNKTKEKLSLEKNKEKATELAITAGILNTVHANLLKNIEKIPFSNQDIKENFDNINPKELNSIQLREYVKIGMEKIENNEEYNSNKLSYAINTVKKEDKLVEEYKLAKMSKQFDDDLKKVASGISVVADKKLRYNKEKYVNLPSLPLSSEQKDFLQNLQGLSDEEKKGALEFKYKSLQGLLMHSMVNKVEIDPIQSTISIDSNKEDTIKLVENSLKKYYQENYENSISKQDMGDKTIFTISKALTPIAGFTETSPDSSGLYTCKIPPGGSIRKILQNIRDKSIDMKEKKGKVLPFRIVADNTIIPLDPGSERNNVLIVEGKSGSGKSSLLLSNLINAAYNDTKQTRQITILDVSRKFWSTPEMKKLKDILIKKGILEDPFAKFDELPVLQGKDLKNYVDTYYKHFLKTLAVQSKLLEFSNVNRIENTKDAIPIKEIYVDEFKLLLNTIKRDYILTKKEKDKCISDINSIIVNTETEGKKHGIYLTMLSQSGVDEPTIQSTIRTINKDVMLFNPANDPFNYERFPSGHTILTRKMSSSPNNIAYLPNGSVPIEGEGKKKKISPTAISKKIEYIGKNNLTQLLDSLEEK